MKKIKSIILSLLTLIVGVTCVAGGTSAFADTYDFKSKVWQNSSVTFNDYTTASLYSSYIDSPSLSWTQFNTAVQFVWGAGSGGNALQFSRNGIDWSTVNSDTYILNEFSNILNHNNRCEPFEHMFRTYNTSTGEYSGSDTLQQLRYSEDGYFYYFYGEFCKYEVVNGITRVVATSYVPTSFDQSGYVWEHNSGYNHWIRGTIAYGDAIADIEVRIPFMFTYSSSVTLSGVTFTLRTGPNKCSIKAGSSNVLAGEVKFSFGVD